MKYQIYLPMAKEIVDALQLYNQENQAGRVHVEHFIARKVAEAVKPWMEPKSGTRCARCGQWVPDMSTMVWNTKTGTGMHYDCWLEGVRERRAWEDDFMKGESRGKEKSKPESGAPGEADLSADKAHAKRGIPRDQPQADPGGLPPHHGPDCASGGDDLPGTGSPAKDGGAGDGGGSGVNDPYERALQEYRKKLTEVLKPFEGYTITERTPCHHCVGFQPKDQEKPQLPESKVEIPMPKVKPSKKQKTISCQTRAWRIYNIVMDEVEVGTPNGEIVDLIYDQIQEYEADLIETTASDLKRKTRKWSMGGYQPKGDPGRATLPKPPKGGSGESGMNAIPEPLWKLFIDQFVRAERAVDEIIKTFCLDEGKENQDDLMGILRKVILQPRDCGGMLKEPGESTESGPLWRDFLYVVLKKDQYKDTLKAYVRHVGKVDGDVYLDDVFKPDFEPGQWKILKDLESEVGRDIDREVEEEKEADGG